MNDAIIRKIEELGYNTIDPSWYSYVQLWNSWYEGYVRSFHDYRVYNGHDFIKCRRYSLSMPKKVCEDWSDLLMNEKVKITLEGKAEQDFIDKTFRENDFEVNANELQEKGAARGAYAIIPRVTNTSIAGDGRFIRSGSERIEMDYITAESIFPLSWSGRKITECAFSKTFTQGKNSFVYMQMHVKNGANYEIYNVMFRSTGGLDAVSLTQVPLSDARGYENIPEILRTNSDKKQFVIGRYNIANNISDNVPLGISVFANAIDELKGIDIAYDSYVNEFVMGKRRIIVKPSTTKHIDGEPVFDTNDTVYYVLPADDPTDDNIIMPIDIGLRTSEHEMGLQSFLNQLSSKCGFGQQHYMFERGNVSTATQIISENSDMFRTIKKHEIVLESMLIELCRILLRLGNTYMGLHLNEDVEISVDFDDSIIEDKTAERLNDRQDLAAGIMNPYEYRMKWYNEDEATAKAALPGIEEFTMGVTQSEVE